MKRILSVLIISVASAIVGALLVFSLLVSGYSSLMDSSLHDLREKLVERRAKDVMSSEVSGDVNLQKLDGAEIIYREACGGYTGTPCTWHQTELTFSVEKGKGYLYMRRIFSDSQIPASINHHVYPCFLDSGLIEISDGDVRKIGKLLSLPNYFPYESGYTVPFTDIGASSLYMKVDSKVMDTKRLSHVSLPDRINDLIEYILNVAKEAKVTTPEVWPKDEKCPL